MQDNDVVAAAVLEDACFSLEELASACAVNPEWVIRHVEEGVLISPGGAVLEWRFTSRDLARLRHIRAMERDFDAVPELAALVADLLDEIDRLRARLRRAGLA
jgi:chaperone modulatory protein CbpM